MTIDLHPVRNNPDLPAFFKQHILKRIEEQNGEYGLAWRLIRRYREGRYCLAKKAGGRLCLFNAKVPGDGPRGRCGWHGGTGNTGPKTAAGKKRVGDSQRLRWIKYRAANDLARDGDAGWDHGRGCAESVEPSMDWGRMTPNCRLYPSTKQS